MTTITLTTSEIRKIKSAMRAMFASFEDVEIASVEVLESGHILESFTVERKRNALVCDVCGNVVTVNLPKTHHRPADWC